KTDIKEGHCHLCKEPLVEEAEKANAKRLLQEMELQVKESKSLLEAKKSKLLELVTSLPQQLESARALQRELDVVVENNQSTRDQTIDNSLIEKGSLDRKSDYLSQQIETVEILDTLKREIVE